LTCPRCKHENRAGAKFCEECATPLARACSSCGSPLSATAKFCPECAHSVERAAPQPLLVAPESYTPKFLAEKILTSRSSFEGERKQVTVLFADLKGSMELLAERDPEEARSIHFERAIDLARRRDLKSLELRAATSLARVWREHGRRADARRTLADVYGWFTEGFDTADLRDARTVLDELGPAE
jgi:hypothetical protein